MSDEDRKVNAKANEDVEESTEDVEAHVKSKHANDDGEEVQGHVKSKHANDEGDGGDDVEAHVKSAR